MILLGESLLLLPKIFTPEKLIKRTLVLLVYSCIAYSVNIKEYWDLNQSHSNYVVILPLGKLMPSVDYFQKLVYMHNGLMRKLV